jgi:N-acetylmuramoyl-L-alanine amidase
MMRQLTVAVAFLASAAVDVAAGQSAVFEVTAVRCWSLSDATRVAIEITGDAHFRSDRIQNPDRIFFDFMGTRPYIDGKRGYSEEVHGRLLKRVRVAETAPGVTRVVLDLESPAEFTVSRLDSPNRFIIELRPEKAVASADRPQHSDESTAEPARREPESVRRQPKPMKEPSQRTATSVPPTIPDPPALRPDVPKTQIARIAAKPATLPPPVVVVEPPAPGAAGPSGEIAGSAPRAGSPRAVPKPARVDSDGERSLIRTLGLKVNRVVIDPGHGGADEGTVGRRGLMEKDLVLDVAKRLGKLIEERMGSEVIYTRTDDTFIPLHARTELANEKKADLFLSIHANSSPHPRIGGIEVYYLNLTRSADALDVAARENASSEMSVFELHDLIQTITLHDKIEESKGFASHVQASLQTFESRYNPTAKNRGVKKAPFVVLIGASMPSVLAEVGFLSNAREEQLLKRAEHRQKLAESLYQGVSRYAQTLSHYQVARRTPETE